MASHDLIVNFIISCLHYHGDSNLERISLYINHRLTEQNRISQHCPQCNEIYNQHLQIYLDYLVSNGTIQRLDSIYRLPRRHLIARKRRRDSKQKDSDESPERKRLPRSFATMKTGQSIV